MYKTPLRLGSCCPECGSVMGIEESDWNKCGCCGYPDTEDEEQEDDLEERMQEVDEQRMSECKCGAYQTGTDGKIILVADCVC